MATAMCTSPDVHVRVVTSEVTPVGDEVDEAEAEAFVLQIDFPLLMETLTFTVDQLQVDLPVWVDDTGPGFAELAGYLKAVEKAREGLKMVEAVLNELTEKAMPRDVKSIYLEGVGQVERHRTGSRKAWQSERLLPVVVARALDERQVDEDTGEYEREAEAVTRVLAECARFEWRVGKTPNPEKGEKGNALRRLGIDPDDYSTPPDGPVKVTIS